MSLFLYYIPTLLYKITFIPRFMYNSPYSTGNVYEREDESWHFDKFVDKDQSSLNLMSVDCLFSYEAIKLYSNQLISFFLSIFLLYWQRNVSRWNIYWYIWHCDVDTPWVWKVINEKLSIEESGQGQTNNQFLSIIKSINVT